MNQTELFAKVLERVFSSKQFYDENSKNPVDMDILKSFDTGPARFYPRPTLKSINNGPTVTPFNKKSTPRPDFDWPMDIPYYKGLIDIDSPYFKGPLGIPVFKEPTERSIYRSSTVTPSTTTEIHKKTTETTDLRRRQWQPHIGTHDRSASRPTFSWPAVPKWPTTRERWDLKPPDVKVEPPVHVITSSHSTNLENFLWVTLGGIVVLVLLALFMKIGKPIRRARRQLSNSRRVTDVSSLRQEPDDRYMDVGSLLRLTDTEPAPACEDLPPPYSECVSKCDPEEPPPRFSACFVTYTNPKDAEPKVHIPQNTIRDQSSQNDSNDITPRIRTELILVNGRIVESPWNANNNDTVLASNHSTVERTRYGDVKPRIVLNNETDHVKINVY